MTRILRTFGSYQGRLDDSERDSPTSLLKRKAFDESFITASVPVTARSGDKLPGRRADGPTRRPAATGSA